MSDDDRTLCVCGKVGWAEKADAKRAAKVLNGINRNGRGKGGSRGPGAPPVVAHPCRRGSGLWHAGSERATNRLRNR